MVPKGGIECEVADQEGGGDTMVWKGEGSVWPQAEPGPCRHAS